MTRIVFTNRCESLAVDRLVALPDAVSHAYALVDSGLGRTLRFTSSGDCAAVVWNPGAGVTRRETMTSVLEPDEWRHFVCIENGTATKDAAYVLPPGGQHTLTRSIVVTLTHHAQIAEMLETSAE